MKSNPQLIEAYFDTRVGSIAWREGKRLFQQQMGKIRVDDGDYNCQLVTTRLEVPRGRTPVYVFKFLIAQNIHIEKMVLLDTAENVASVLLDLAKVGVEVTTSQRLLASPLRVAEDRPSVWINVETQGEVQKIRILDKKVEPEVTEKDVESLLQASSELIAEEAGLPPAPSPNEAEKPTVAIPETPAIEENADDIEIFAGDRIRISRKGEKIDVEVIETLDFHHKLLVRLPDGEEGVVDEKDIRAKLG